MDRKLFKCSVCGKSFYTEINLKIHTRKAHGNGSGGQTPGPIKKPKGK